MSGSRSVTALDERGRRGFSKAAAVDNLGRQSRSLSNAAAGPASYRALFKANHFCLFIIRKLAVIGGGEVPTLESRRDVRQRHWTANVIVFLNYPPQLLLLKPLRPRSSNAVTLRLPLTTAQVLDPG